MQSALKIALYLGASFGGHPSPAFSPHWPQSKLSEYRPGPSVKAEVRPFPAWLSSSDPQQWSGPNDPYLQTGGHLGRLCMILELLSDHLISQSE